MQIFLFVIDGVPGFRYDLAGAQVALGDRLRDNPNVSDVWWDDKHPYEARTYLYGASHTDYVASGDPMEDDISWETTDQLIWPVTVNGIESVPRKQYIEGLHEEMEAQQSQQSA